MTKPRKHSRLTAKERQLDELNERKETRDAIMVKCVRLVESLIPDDAVPAPEQAAMLQDIQVSISRVLGIEPEETYISQHGVERLFFSDDD